MIYKPRLDILIVDWLFRQNHKENKDAEIPSIQMDINAIQTTTNIPECMTMHKLQQVTSQDEHLQHLKEYIIQGWPESRDQITLDMRTNWMFLDDMAVIDKVIQRKGIY